MAGLVSVQEAVRLAKEGLGNAPPQDLAAWISTTFGMTVKPVIVTVMLGSFLEQEQVDRLRQVAVEMVEKAKAEPPEEMPKKGKKSSQQGDASKSPDAKERRSTGSGCPDCGSADYVFRGRRKVAPEPGEQGQLVETKRACRACGYQWKVRATA